MSVKLVSTQSVVLRHKLHWTVKNITSNKSEFVLNFPDEILGDFYLKLEINKGKFTKGIMGDGWIMNPEKEASVSFVFNWSPPEDKKLSMVCGLTIGKTPDLPDVNLDDEDSYKVKVKFGFLNDQDFCRQGNQVLSIEGFSIEDKVLSKQFSVKAEVMIVPFEIEREFNQVKSTGTFLTNVRSIQMGDENSDIKIICSGKEFNVHKNIICARSEVFRKAFSHETKENDAKEYTLKETTSDACEEMLKFLYTGVPGNISHCHGDLLRLADMYQMQELKAACLDSMMDRLNVSNCILTFINVNKYATVSRIRKDILQFMNCKVTQVIEESNWNLFLKHYPGLATDLVRSLAGDKKFKHHCQYCRG